ncbi:MAG: biopolymer transporter ExbD [Candidatus Nitrohelix vancouverensis]|uniref:Biopolymer transporter ExbD n=1 Tax=Candidatus Nitrohelix vancouverensis TaxID=2705534 RepID=A0A7T0C4N8_9BACT|nr:MAG: biopolymer transporter ExbD [Candidatus Nitrohelix vancouverensis]
MQFRKEEDDNFALDLTPLIDVVFLLLIFFMVSTVFVDFNRRMDLTLPSSKASTPNEPSKQLNIEMTIDHKIYFSGAQVTVQQLEEMFAKMEPEKKKSAVIHADKGLSFGKVVEVMGVLNAEHVEDVSIAVK